MVPRKIQRRVHGTAASAGVVGSTISTLPLPPASASASSCRRPISTTSLRVRCANTCLAAVSVSTIFPPRPILSGPALIKAAAQRSRVSARELDVVHSERRHVAPEPCAARVIRSVYIASACCCDSRMRRATRRTEQHAQRGRVCVVCL
jgi:hypothetical protein